MAAVLPRHSGASSIGLSHESDAATNRRENAAANEATTAKARNAFARLPLSFEANHGQTDAQVLFLARGKGYGLFLTANGAVFSFTGLSTPLRMHFEGAAPAPRITGVNQLPGKVNYLVGNEPDKWRTNVATYERVRYEQIYKGVDLVYYGNQRQLEYDFVVAPHASYQQIRLAFEGAGKLKLNRRGHLVWQNGARQIILQRPKAYQEVKGKRRVVTASYRVKANGEVGFKIGNYDRNLPLVIDPVLAYATYLGGNSQDLGVSVALDSAGNTYIAGDTSSLNFPTAAPMEPNNSGATDVFVTKLNTTGSTMIYSTYIGGAGIDFPQSIAVDGSGNAYVAGQTGSPNFPVFSALHPTYSGGGDAFVFELNAAGSAPIFSTFLGGAGGDIANSVALDNLANIYVTGNTGSSDFPTTNPIQPNRAGTAIFKTTNAAGNWNASGSGLSASVVNHLVFSPGNTSIVYAATNIGVFKSTDNGQNWTSAPGQTGLFVNKLAIDPSNTNIIYAATNSGMFKSTDAGNTFAAINNGINPTFARIVTVDPITPTTVYALSVSNLFFKSTDGGANWTPSFVGVINITINEVTGLVIDPTTPTTLYAATNRGVLKSTNGAASWALSNTGFPFSNIRVPTITIDSTNPNVLYAGTSAGIFKSVNGAASWTSITGNLPPFGVQHIAPDPTNASIIYIVALGTVQKTIDGGATWNVSATGYPGTTINTLLIDPAHPATLYIGTSSGSDAFVTKLGASGVSQLYSTYFGGSTSDSANGIAIDAGGNAYIAGSTTSTNFPTLNAIQPVNGGGGDAFVTKLNAAGSAAVYSTFLGGNAGDSGIAIAVDASGNAYVGGTTFSQNFPTSNAFQPANASFNGDAFLAKINPSGSAFVYSTFLGGTGTDQCFAIAVDSNGSAYLAGTTGSASFPVLGAPQPALSGFSDAFVTKFAPNGLSLLYSTFLGGIGQEEAWGIAVDASQNTYVVGWTDSPDLPTVNALQANYGGITDAFIAKLSPAPEVAVSIIDSPDPVNFGANLTYTINVVNNGDTSANNVTLTDTIPAGAIFVSATSNVGSCTGTSPIVCTLGKINPGVSVTVTVVVKPPAVRTAVNIATATLNEADSFPANNTATSETLVDFADLAITKNAAQTLAAPGAKITYSLVVRNKGVLPAAVTVTDNLPSGLSLNKCSTTSGVVCGGSGNNVSVVFPSLAPAAAEVVLITAQVSAAATAGTLISNTASASSPLPDPDTSNNSSTALVAVASTPILQRLNGIIAFAADRAFTPVAEPSGIYKINSDGTNETLFPNIPLNARRPSWSPDGAKLAYEYTNFAGNSPVNEISIINANGTGSMKIAENISQFNRNIAWSPNGTQIAFIGAGSQFNAATIRTVTIANVDGSGSYQLPGSPTFLSSVDWSPDGTKFVYATDNEIFVMNADGTNQTKLTTQEQTNDGATIDSDPHWSPDGAKILLTRSTTNSNSVYVMNADGSNLMKLFNPGGRDADWSPDGQIIVLQQGNEICTINVNGTNQKCLTNNIYYDFSPNWQALPGPATLQFAATTPSVPENIGSTQVVVNRSGDIGIAATVNYATADTAGLAACTVVNGKASERCDYETAVGTLRFAPGETSQSFTLPIVDDAHVEGAETFTITLSSATGATINAPATITFTIADNDAAPSSQNPIDGVQFFVTQQYIDFLGRMPDSTGLANWMATLNGCPNGGFGENDNPSCDRVHVSAGFFLSDEFRGRGYWAYRFYEVGFDRRPLYAEFVPDMAQVGGAQSPESELLSKAAYTDSFVQRSEFTNRYNGLSNSAYVNALEQNAEITLSNKAALIAALDGNQKTRGQVLREIVESKDVEDRFFIR
ncbi:MAG TPA: SBBP repeat-containing protein, partial [Pyrinomonadaceae bacterium]|nr:SBBP repeat-containing protein [Pyrinomonadaceae bacterium]